MEKNEEEPGPEREQKEDETKKENKEEWSLPYIT